jgi:hypothetical protein
VRELGVSSTSTAYSHVQALKRHGILRDTGGHIALAPGMLCKLLEMLQRQQAG